MGLEIIEVYEVTLLEIDGGIHCHKCEYNDDTLYVPIDKVPSDLKSIINLNSPKRVRHPTDIYHRLKNVAVEKTPFTPLIVPVKKIEIENEGYA